MVGKTEILRKSLSIWTLGDIMHYSNHNIISEYPTRNILQNRNAAFHCRDEMASEIFRVPVTVMALNVAPQRNCIVMKTDF